MRKQVLRELRGRGLRDIQVKRVPPKVGPAAPLWSARASMTLPIPGVGPMRLVVLATSKSLQKLPQAWEKAFKQAALAARAS